MSAHNRIKGIERAVLSLRMCSVLEWRGMEWNGSVPEEWNGSIPVFGLDKKEKRNDTVFCSVGGIGEQNGMWLN
jgi:hypothetical protein